MKRADEITHLVKKASFSAGTETDEALRAEIARAGKTCHARRFAAGRKETRRRGMKLSTTRIAVAAVVCGGAMAAAVGVKVYRYHFVGRGWDGSYHFRRVPEKDNTKYHGGVTIGGGDPNHTLDIEQTRKDLEEEAILRQLGERELVSVVDKTVNGCFYRSCGYRYTLSDGRTRMSWEGPPNRPIERTPEQIEKDRQERRELRKQGKRKLAGVMETYVDGAMDRICTYEYVLADGRKQRGGESDPELPFLNLVTSDQIHEIWSLRGSQQGEYLGCSDREVHGERVAFETYVFTLSDGTVVTHAVGEVKGRQNRLTGPALEEFRHLLRAGEGVDLGAYEEEVQGRRFLFKPQQFILSDGAEVIWALGKPQNE